MNSASMRDVARDAGVSVATVSAVVNGVDIVKPATLERVQQSIQKLGYIPNQSARGLAAQKTFTVGALCTDYPKNVISDLDAAERQNMFFGTYINRIVERMNPVGYGITVENFSYIENPEALPAILTRSRLDGIFVLGSLYDDHLLETLMKQIPAVVAVGRHTEIADHVQGEYVESMAMCVRYLVNRGHKKIAYACCDKLTGGFRYKMQGFQEAMAEAGLSVDSDMYFPSHQTRSEGYRVGQAVCALPPEKFPTAILCACDTVAAGIYQCFSEKGIRIPQDVSLIGYENLLFDRYLIPNLTSVDFHKEEMVECACEMMIERIRDPQRPIQSVVIPYTIVERESVREL